MKFVKLTYSILFLIKTYPNVIPINVDPLVLPLTVTFIGTSELRSSAVRQLNRSYFDKRADLNVLNIRPIHVQSTPNSRPIHTLKGESLKWPVYRGPSQQEK